MLKKVFIVTAVLLLAASVLFAGGAKQQAPAGGGKTTVQFWYSQGGAIGEVLQNCVKAFNASHPDIEVVATFQGNYWEAVTKIQNAIGAGGDLPDCFQMGTGQVSGFSAEEGVLADLQPLMRKTGMDPKDFPEVFVWDYYVNGKLIALPFGRSTPMLYANKDMLDAAGLKMPTTWDELKQVCNALVQKQGNEYLRQGMVMPRDSWYFWMFLGQAGGKMLNADMTAMGCLDDGTAKTAWGFLQDLQRSGGMYYVPVGVDATGLFLAEKFGLYMTSVGSMNGIFDNAKFNVEAAWIPRGKVQTVVSGGNSLCMLESSTNKDAAWTFIDWLYTNPDGLANYVVATGYYPPKRSMVQLPAIQAAWKANPYKELAFGQLDFASDKHWMYPQTNAVNAEMDVFIDAIMYDLKDIDEQLNIMNRSVQQLLRR